MQKLFIFTAKDELKQVFIIFPFKKFKKFIKILHKSQITKQNPDNPKVIIFSIKNS